MRLTNQFTALLCGTVFSMSLFAQMQPTNVMDGVLTGVNGKTLYTFDKDEIGSGKSTCYDACAANWPPFTVAEGEKATDDYSIIERNDGIKQWAYKGSPLYYFVKDTKAGEKNGDGFKNIWKVAKP